MSFSSKIFFYISSLIVFFTLSWCEQSKETSITRDKIVNENKSMIVNCELSLSSTIFSDHKSEYKKIQSESNIEKSPLKITLIDLDTDQPKMKWNNWESTLKKIDNWDFFYLVEKTAIGNINIFTFFPKENILFLSKAYNLWWPFWLQMAWFCN